MLKKSVKQKVSVAWDEEGIFFSTSEDLSDCINFLKETKRLEDFWCSIDTSYSDTSYSSGFIVIKIPKIKP